MATPYPGMGQIGGGGGGVPSIGNQFSGPTGQWLRSLGFNVNHQSDMAQLMQDPASLSRLTQAWQQLPASQQFSMLQNPQGGGDLSVALASKLNPNAIPSTQLGAFFNANDVNNVGEAGSTNQAQGIGNFTGYTASGGGVPYNPATQGQGYNPSTGQYAGGGGNAPYNTGATPATGGGGSGGGGAQPTPPTLGSMAGGGSGPGNYPAIPAGNIPLPSSQGGYGLNIGAYQNPMAGYMQDWANKALQSTYAGAGDLLSGPAMQGITDYNQKMALGNSYAPAAAMAAQQQGVGIGLDQYNQNMAFQQMLNQQGLNQYNQQFGYQQQLANQTIPFQQQMALAQLGLQGTQGAQGVTNLLATLLSQNALGAGQAAGAGTQGQSTAISQMIQSMLQNYLQQNLLNRIPALNQGTGQ